MTSGLSGVKALELGVWGLGPVKVSLNLAASSSRAWQHDVSVGVVCSVVGSTWDSKVCKIMTFMPIILGLGLLFCILSGFK